MQDGGNSYGARELCRKLCIDSGMFSMDAKCYMTQFNLNWYRPHRSHINSPPRWHFCCLCKRTQLYRLTGSYD